MPEVVTIGEAMVLFSPIRNGLLRYSQTFERFMAGAESNTAIGLARLGHNTGWISRVGDDEFGQYILSFLRGECVDVSQVQRDQSAQTGIFFKERRNADLTRVYYYRADSAASNLSPSDIDVTYFKGTQLVHITGITPALSDSCLKMTHHVLEVCASSNITVSFDPNIRFKLWESSKAKQVLLELISHTKIVLASQDEAIFLTDQPTARKAALSILDLGPKQVIIKLGPSGALGVSHEKVVHKPGIEVQAVETIGAGDAFNAGYLSGYLRGWDLEKSLYLGNILGGMATTVHGDVEGIPYWNEIQSFFGGDEQPHR